MQQVQMALKQGTDQKTIVDGAMLGVRDGLHVGHPFIRRGVGIVNLTEGILYCADGIEPDLQERLRLVGEKGLSIQSIVAVLSVCIRST